jgi:hypothetical protein
VALLSAGMALQLDASCPVCKVAWNIFPPTPALSIQSGRRAIPCQKLFHIHPDSQGLSSFLKASSISCAMWAPDPVDICFLKPTCCGSRFFFRCPTSLVFMICSISLQVQLLWACSYLVIWVQLVYLFLWIGAILASFHTCETIPRLQLISLRRTAFATGPILLSDLASSVPGSPYPGRSTIRRQVLASSFRPLRGMGVRR